MIHVEKLEPPGQFIVVAGAPGSGNRLVRHGIWRWLQASGQRVHVDVWHGAEPWPRPEDVIAIVIPVRNPAIQQRSAPGKGCEIPPSKLFPNVARLVLESGAPVLPLSYEGLVQDPEGVGRHLCAWLGLRWDGWGATIRDGNARYLRRGCPECGGSHSLDPRAVGNVIDCGYREAPC
jgi:hypothetical protein